MNQTRQGDRDGGELGRRAGGMAHAKCLGRKQRGGEGRMKPLTVDKIIKDVTLTVTVKYPAGFKIRLALSMFLIRLAAKILGCGIEMEVVE